MHHPDDPRPVRRATAARMACLCALLGTLAGGSIAAVPGALPEQPSDGLRITVAVSCDFEDRWWEAALHPGALLPLEFRSRTPGMFGNRDRDTQYALDSEARGALYALIRAAFAGFSVDRRPDFSGPGSNRPWTGERTITLAALVLDDELGRVDRVELAVDVIRGRSLPAATLALVDAVAAFDARASLELDCS